MDGSIGVQMRYYSISMPVAENQSRVVKYFRTLEDVQEVVEEVLTRNQAVNIILTSYIVSPEEYEKFWTVRLLDGPTN
jgi:hypothetical protein